MSYANPLYFMRFLLIASVLLSVMSGCSRINESPPSVSAATAEEGAAMTLPAAEPAQIESQAVPSNSEISLVVRDYDAFRPIISANGGYVTQKNSWYEQKSLNINIQEDKNKSLADVFVDGAEIAGVSITEYALSISDLKNANINTRICYSVSSNKNDCVILTKKERDDGFLSGKDIVHGVKDSESLYDFLEKYYNLTQLNNSKKDFLEGLKTSVILHKDFDSAFKAFNEENADFIVMTEEQYKSVSDEAGRRGYRIFLGGSSSSAIPKDTINVLVYRAGRVTNDISSIITGALYVLNEDYEVNDAFNFDYASKEKSIELLSGHNTAEDIICDILNLKATVEQITKEKIPPSSSDIINTAMLEAAPQPEPLEKVGNYVGKNIGDISDEEKGKFIFEQVAETSYLPEGEIIKQDPEAGEYRPIGDKIILTVSTGTPPVKIPNLYGKTVEDAKSTLATLKLNVGAVYESHRDDVSPGLIVEQSVAVGSEVKEGAYIELTVSTDELIADDRQSIAPDLLGMTVQDAANKLKPLGLKLKVEGSKYVDDKSQSDKVVSQYPTAGTKLVDCSTVSVRMGITYTVFPINIKFTAGVFNARGIQYIKDADGNMITKDQLAKRIADYAKSQEGKSIEVYGFVSSQYNNPTPSIVAANEELATTRANAVREILQKESEYLRGITIRIKGVNVPSGVEGVYNYDDCRVEIRFQN